MANAASDQKEIEYVSFPLSKIAPGIPLPGDLYLFINGHFVKYKTKEDDLPTQKFEIFINQKVQYLFIDRKDLDSYKKWHADLVAAANKEIIHELGPEVKPLIEKQSAARDEYFSFIAKDVTDESVKEMVSKTRDFISAMKENKQAEKFIAKLFMHERSVGDHCTNVANMSVFLAMNTGYSQQLILEHIYLGALLHDYGKTKIDKKNLEAPTNSKQYITAMRKHPEVGKTSLLIDSGFPDEVLRIIGEHHEKNDGTGYPKGLKGGKIYELTKIVSVANTFDNYIMEMDPKEDHFVKMKKAFKMLESDQGKIFDPKILAKCLRTIERVMT